MKLNKKNPKKKKPPNLKKDKFHLYSIILDFFPPPILPRVAYFPTPKYPKLDFSLISHKVDYSPIPHREDYSLSPHKVDCSLIPLKGDCSQIPHREDCSPIQPLSQYPFSLILQQAVHFWTNNRLEAMMTSLKKEMIYLWKTMNLKLTPAKVKETSNTRNKLIF